MPCEKEKPYVCEKVTAVTTTPADARNCDNGWKGFNGHCYQYSGKSKLDGFAANDVCNQKGGYLLRIDNDAEVNFLRTFIESSLLNWIFVRLGVLGLNIYILHSVTTLDWRLFWSSITMGVEK